MKRKLFTLCISIFMAYSMNSVTFAADLADGLNDKVDVLDLMIDETENNSDILINRAMFVTMLYKMENAPSFSVNHNFYDVSPESNYADAVTWAVENGIVSGIGNGQFAPNAPLSRQQLASILYRYAEYKGYSTQYNNDFTNISDVEEISHYAQIPLCWAVDTGIITKEQGKIFPTNTVTYAQANEIIMNFNQNVGHSAFPNLENSAQQTYEQNVNSENQQSTEQRRMKISVGDTTLYAVLADNETADAIVQKLPLTLDMMDLYGREMCYRFDEELPATDIQTRNFELGEIIYWAPRHSFVIMYHQDGEVFSMQHVGQIESGVEIFDTTGDVTVTFELLE